MKVSQHKNLTQQSTKRLIKDSSHAGFLVSHAHEFERIKTPNGNVLDGRDDRARSAEAAISNPLMDDFSLRGALGVLISITGGKDLTLYEVDEAATRIREEVDADANIIVGATFEESFDGIIRVSVVATGVDINSASNVGPAVCPHAPAPLQGRAA
jgi:cell division GTPase FtsZ